MKEYEHVQNTQKCWTFVGHNHPFVYFITYQSTNMPNYDQKVQDIITEEAAAFFNGQKSAEDVSKIIQSRVTIYVKENQ